MLGKKNSKNNKKGSKSKSVNNNAIAKNKNSCGPVEDVSRKASFPKQEVVSVKAWNKNELQERVRKKQSVLVDADSWTNSVP